MDVDEGGAAMIVAGIGSRSGVTEAEVLAAIDIALATHGLERGALARLATATVKRGEPGMHAAAAALGLELGVVDDAALAGVRDRVPTRSAASAAVAGTPSVAEASALAAAGRDGRLLGPRIAVGPVTCAIAAAGTAGGRT